MMDIVGHIQCAWNAARVAGREIMEVYQGAVAVSYKEDRSPLTEADLRAHGVIDATLRAAYPDVPVLSEEAASIPYARRRDWSSCWLVDPLDGTKEFIKRNGEFTVNIAYVQDGIPLAGVVYAPALDRAYLGALGWGAYRLDGVGVSDESLSWEDTLARAVVLPEKQAHRPYTVVASRSHMSSETEAFVAHQREAHPDLQLLSAGSALKLCLVAEGSADVYPRYAPTMEWDTAAGHAICAACAIPVTAHPGGASLVYNKEDLLNPWFLVGPVE